MEGHYLLIGRGEEKRGEEGEVEKWAVEMEKRM